MSVEPTATTGGADDTEHVIKVFAGNSRKGSWHVPRSIRAINIFGGTELDFTNAHFTASTTYIPVFCLFGGLDMRVRNTPREKLREFADHLRAMFTAPPPRA